ncbi:MAG: C25 family cysteine peptidase, partial [Armatimonadota bacterium]|nr:C25 family cysteine peptidase [Armatimonadota bacterium]
MTPRRFHLSLLLAAAVGLLLPKTAAAAAYKIGVRRTGLYRVTGKELARAGVPIGQVDPRTLVLAVKGDEVAIGVTGEEDGRFDPDDAVEFYGTALDTKYTDTNVYWLSWGNTRGKRWTGAAPVRGEAEASYLEKATFEENALYAKQLFVADPGEIPHWFWASISAKQQPEFTFQLDNLDLAAPAARVGVFLWGNTTLPTVEPDHHTRVFLNGNLLEDARWDGQVPRAIQREVPTTWLKEGENHLRIECPGDTAAGELDIVFLDRIEVNYRRRLVARQGTLEFTADADARSFAIQGMGAPADVRALDVTRPEAVRRLPVETREGRLVVSGLSPGGRAFVCDSARALSPAWVVGDTPSRLRDPENGADYLVVAGDEVADGIQPLVEWRRKQGLRVCVARVGDVYDEFSAGVFTPVAIRDFVAYACQRWRGPRPRFLLLVGDANYDYRDYLGTGVKNILPAYLVRIWNGMETPFDGWYAALPDGDALPDLAVGRIPAQNAADARMAAERIIAYEEAAAAPWMKRVLFVADHDRPDNRPGWYEQVCDSIIAEQVKGNLEYRYFLLRRDEVLAINDSNERSEWVRRSITPELLAAINEGALVVEYQGHGDAQYWSRFRVLELEDLARLRNDARRPVFLEISCFTGWFDNPRLPEGRCLA